MLDRQFLDLDLFSPYLAKAAAKHRSVLAERCTRRAVDGAVAGDTPSPSGRFHRVRSWCCGVWPARPARQTILIQQRVDTPAGNPACPGVYFFDGILTDGCSDTLRLCSSASLPAVVWMSMVCSVDRSAE